MWGHEGSSYIVIQTNCGGLGAGGIILWITVSQQLISHPLIYRVKLENFQHLAFRIMSIKYNRAKYDLSHQDDWNLTMINYEEVSSDRFY